MSPIVAPASAPVGLPKPAATLPVPVSATSAHAPTSAAIPGTVPGAKPTGPAGAGAPTSDAAKAAQALVGDIKGLVTETKGLDGVWATSALTAKAALDTLPKDAKLDPAAKSSIERILFSGKVLGIDIPKDAKPITLDGKQSATTVILGAEQAFQGAVTTLAGKSVDVLKRVPDGVPKEINQVLSAVRERVTDGLYAIKFSKRIAPPPAAPAAPGTATAPGTKPAPASGTVPSPTTAPAVPGTTR